MNVDRRKLLQFAAGTAVVSGLQAAMPASAARPAFKGIAFDAFPIFDPRPVAALAESLFPGNGPAIMNGWRTRQFEYQWLHALAGRYVDFLQATEESLIFAFRQLHLELPADKKRQLVSSYSNLRVWPDVVAGITALHAAGVRLAFLSNMTYSMLHEGIASAGLENKFEAILSSDQIRSYKPDPRTYQLAVDRLQLRREEILFVAFAGWDVAGAKWFGYPTYWVNRLDSPMEELGVEADASGPDLQALVRFVLGN
jgi:2-haloacid dehalogenase